MTIYARNRYRMWTAFNHRGHAILNIADPSAAARSASILIDDERLVVFTTGSDRAMDDVVEDLFAHGIRLAEPVPTPALGTGTEMRLAA